MHSVSNTSQKRALRNRGSRTISGDTAIKGRILEALHRSPLVGAELALTRALTNGRKVKW